jgi:hypothetical protein
MPAAWRQRAFRVAGELYVSKIHYAKSERVVNNTNPIFRSIMNQGKEKERIGKFNNKITNSKKISKIGTQIIATRLVQVFSGI